MFDIDIKEPISIFISQPLENKTIEQIDAMTKEAIDTVSDFFGADDILVFNSNYSHSSFCNSYDKSQWQSKTVGLKMLSESLSALSQATYAIFCPGWEKSYSCIIEKECCKKFGIETFLL